MLDSRCCAALQRRNFRKAESTTQLALLKRNVAALMTPISQGPAYQGATSSRHALRNY
jgi:hypothetical protein